MQATSSSMVLFATLKSLDPILRAAELPDTPFATAMPNSAWFHSHCRHLHNFLLLFVLFLQFQMPTLPGKTVFIVLSCILDNLELFFLNLAWTFCQWPPVRSVVRINSGTLLFCDCGGVQTHRLSCFTSVLLLCAPRKWLSEPETVEVFWEPVYAYQKHAPIHLGNCFSSVL